MIRLVAINSSKGAFWVYTHFYETLFCSYVCKKSRYNNEPLRGNWLKIEHQTRRSSFLNATPCGSYAFLLSQ